MGAKFYSDSTIGRSSVKCDRTYSEQNAT